MKIKVLKDTPFHKANTVLELREFRQVYNYICANTVTESQLETYLMDWINNPVKGGLNEWFGLTVESDVLPLQFFVDDVLYTKEFDGMYRGWNNISHYRNFMELANTKPIISIHIQEARDLIKNAKYKNLVLHCTDHVNAKLG